jgi:hypothetical protein
MVGCYRPTVSVVCDFLFGQWVLHWFKSNKIQRQALVGFFQIAITFLEFYCKNGGYEYEIDYLTSF